MQGIERARRYRADGRVMSHRVFAIALCVASCLTACAPKTPAAKGPTPIDPGTGRAVLSEPASMDLVATAPTPIIMNPITRVETPALAAEFNNLFSDGRMYFSGWPSEAGLRALAARGVKKIIMLRPADALVQARGYDPRAVAKSVGITLIEMPVSADTLSDAYIDRFAREVDASTDPTLMQCGASSTCGMVWGSYLARSKGMAPSDALAQARAAGLLDGPQADAAAKYINAQAKAASPSTSTPSTSTPGADSSTKLEK